MVDSLNRLNPKVIFVTDPMCSWCWGMADSIKEIHEKYKDKIELDLMLGGTNIDSTVFVGDYGKNFFCNCGKKYVRQPEKSLVLSCLNRTSTTPFCLVWQLSF